MARPHVLIRDVVISYGAGPGTQTLHAAGPLRLEIGEGAFVTLVGPSGCGKTSLLNAIAGLVPIPEGQILIHGRPVTGPGIDRALVFQDYALLPWRTVRDNVSFGLTLSARRASASDVERRVSEALRLVGLDEFAHHYPHQLSGGMKQRVGIARALVVEPEILLMDEPFAAVDALTREVMQGELLRILQARRMTVVFVTHSIDEALLLGDSVVVMSARPGQVRDVLTIPFPRPRDPDAVRAAPDYLDLRERIWRTLREDRAFVQRS
ncbi:MAG TPA: ABC transporter ATP-binding protein [Candidatus Methylomirabilis sp.]|nr:ABC transporter ATP-binding protein [Candidatus Methylomirabilis sp.]